MAYYILADQLTGELLQVSLEQIVPAEKQIVKQRQGDLPDLTRHVWHGGSLAFVPKPTRIVTRLAFMRRMTNDELAGIYGTAKVSPLLEVWLDKFKLAEEIDLTDPEIVEGLQWLEAAGLLAAGRAAEVLA